MQQSKAQRSGKLDVVKNAVSAGRCAVHGCLSVCCSPNRMVSGALWEMRAAKCGLYSCFPLTNTISY